MKLSNNNEKAGGSFSKTIFRRVGAATVALSSFLFLTACGESAGDRVEKVGGVTARQVIENPANYVGKTVTVSGDVEEIWGPRAFNMDSGASLGELLVVGREPFPQIPDAGNRAYVVSDVATVTGVVRLLVTADIEREIGWDLDPQIETEFNAKPVLIAQTISFRAGAGRPPAATANTNAAPMNANVAPMNANVAQTGANAEITDVLIIVAEPNRPSLVGRRVRFTNVKVQDVVGDRTFYVGPGANQRMFVALEEEPSPNSPVEGKVDVNPGQTVSFTGTIMAMPTVDEAKKRFGRLMNDAELNALKNQQIYIRTDKVNIAGK
ncbi:MAG TPA: hypothetical protein VNI84_01535 [Pyrinomonadaceae bacterium]|nr:hypothetical protein [Pyrinomonadaceae bacterium]